MPNFTTSQEWLQQSSLLLQARPTTARITSKYSVLAPNSSKVEKRRKKTSSAKSTSSPPPEPSDSSAPAAPLAAFTLKTYDPVSGACLKYKTDKAAEVGRLISSLGRLARHMAALPELAEDTLPDAAGPTEDAPAAPTSSEPASKDPKPTAAPNTGGGGGGGKKKKKGKK